jgi:hypothetical protein
MARPPRGIVTASVMGQLVTTKQRGASDFACPACERRRPSLPSQAHRITRRHHPLRAHRRRQGRHLAPRLVLADNETVRSLAAFLAAERIAGVDPDASFTNRDMFRGILAEAPARQKYAEHYGVEVTECGFMVLDEHDYSIGVSPDGLVGDDGGIEIKSPRQRGHLLTVVSGEVPVAHMAQIQTALLVSGRQWWDFVSYSPGLRMWVKRVHPDPDWFRAIRAAVAGLELEVNRLTDDYAAAVSGFPMTERLDLELEVTA